MATCNSAPTVAILHHIGVLNSGLCQRCMVEEETLLHYVRDCHFARRIWMSFGFVIPVFYFEMDHVQWLRKGIMNEKEPLFIACIWWAWKAGNSHVLAKEEIPFFSTNLAIRNLEEVLCACFYAYGNQDINGHWVQ